jgi:hypothetical protein
MTVARIMVQEVIELGILKVERNKNIAKSFTIILTKHDSFMFCWPCIIVYQYSETNVMHCLLRIKGLCMFRANNALNM